MENLKLVESVLDGLIKSCSQQLFEVTDNLENAAYPFCVPPNGTRLQCHIMFNFKMIAILQEDQETDHRLYRCWFSLTSVEPWPM